MSHRVAQDPHRQVRRDVRRGVQGGRLHALPQSSIRSEDGAESEQSQRTGLKDNIGLVNFAFTVEFVHILWFLVAFYKWV